MRTIDLRNKKGVSPIIATLLLIVIAVAAGVVTYSFVMGFIGGAGGQSGTTGQINIESAVINNATTTTAYVRNTGSKNVNITTAYVDGVLVALNNTAGYTATPGQLQTVVINWGTTDTQSHVLRIVCADSTQASISIRTPS